MIGDGTSYQRMLAKATSETQQTVQQVERASNRLLAFGGRLNSFGTSAVGVISALGVSLSAIGTIRTAVSLAADAERMEVSFSTMLRSAEDGHRMVRQLTEFAAQTPMDLPGIQQAAQMLLQFRVAGNEIIPTLRMIGDVAGGQADKVMRLSRAFGQMTGTGRLQGDELNQMIEAGFNPLVEMVRTTGRSMPELRAAMERGQISVDMVRNAFRTATSAGGDFFEKMLKESRTTSGLFSTMKDDINAVLRDVGQELIDGLNLKGVMEWVSRAAKATQDWLTNLSPGVKTVGMSIVGATAAVIAFGVAIGVAGIIANTAFGGLPVTIGLIASAALAFVGWISTFDSVKAAAGSAWAWIKQKANDFITWAYPVWQAFTGFLGAAWDVAKDAAVTAWEVIKSTAAAGMETLRGLWASIGGGEIDWDAIRDGAVDAFLMAEFALRNFGDVAAYVWTGAKLKAVEFANEVSHFFTDALPAMLGWLKENWPKVFKQVYDWTVDSLATTIMNWQTLFENIPWGRLWEGLKASVEAQIDNIVRVFRSLPALISGAANFAGLWQDQAHEAVGNVIGELQSIPALANSALPPLIIPPRILGEWEQQLRAEFAEMGSTLSENWTDFRRRRLEEMSRGMFEGASAGGDWGEIAGRAGEQVGQNFTRGAAKELQKFEGLLFGSADAMQRLAAYTEQIARDQVGPAMLTAGAGASAPAVGARNPVVVEQNPASERQAMSGVENRLDRAVVELAAIRRQPAVVVEVI